MTGSLFLFLGLWCAVAEAGFAPVQLIDSAGTPYRITSMFGPRMKSPTSFDLHEGLDFSNPPWDQLISKSGEPELHAYEPARAFDQGMVEGIRQDSGGSVRTAVSIQLFNDNAEDPHRFRYYHLFPHAEASAMFAPAGQAFDESMFNETEEVILRPASAGRRAKLTRLAFAGQPIMRMGSGRDM